MMTLFLFSDTNSMIRPVTLADAAAITNIYNYYIEHTSISFETEPLTTEQMGKRIVAISSYYPYLVYEAEGKIAGYCYVHAWKERAASSQTMETTIYLDPRHKRQGIGKQLMDRLISLCREAGYHALVACITASNQESREFHARLGFSEASHFKEVGYKLGEWHDVVDYELLLKP